ncbi:MAG: hypothetical protein ACPGJV_10330 [Bacteriovoracaceae bacterium]
MKTFSLYILLVLMFLGLTKSLSRSSKGTPYIVSEVTYSNFFRGGDLSVILIDSFKTGFLIKTYYHKYLVIRGFRSPKTVIVRTSRRHWERNQPNIGLSLFRRAERSNLESSIPLPPGSLYLGSPAYGTWERQPSGQRVWEFHRVYKQFPKFFGWGEFRPSKDFYIKLEQYKKDNRAFYGLNREFGTEGIITKEAFQYQRENRERKIDFKALFIKLFNIPPWKITESVGTILK